MCLQSSKVVILCFSISYLLVLFIYLFFIYLCLFILTKLSLFKALIQEPIRCIWREKFAGNLRPENWACFSGSCETPNIQDSPQNIPGRITVIWWVNLFTIFFYSGQKTLFILLFFFKVLKVMVIILSASRILKKHVWYKSIIGPFY